MSIQEAIRAQMKLALRERDQRRLDALRQIETEVSRAKSAPGFHGQIDDALYRDVISAYVKRMDKAKQEYENLGPRGKQMAEQLAFEVHYLSQWLPKKLDESATRELLRQTAAELAITDAKQAGQLVGHVMKLHRDEVDGALVNRLARAMLSS